MPEKNRILLTSTQYFHDHYVKEPFNGESGQASPLKLLRPRNKTAEIRDRMVYAHAHENQRITEAIAAVKCTTEPIDPSFLVNPQWRPEEKEKFLTQVSYLRLSGGIERI